MLFYSLLDADCHTLRFCPHLAQLELTSRFMYKYVKFVQTHMSKMTDCIVFCSVCVLLQLCVYVCVGGCDLVCISVEQIWSCWGSSGGELQRHAKSHFSKSLCQFVCCLHYLTAARTHSLMWVDCRSQEFSLRASSPVPPSDTPGRLRSLALKS